MPEDPLITQDTKHISTTRDRLHLGIPIAIAAIILLAAGFLFWNQNKNHIKPRPADNNQNSTTTAEEVHNIFTSPTPTPGNNSVAPGFSPRGDDSTILSHSPKTSGPAKPRTFANPAATPTPKIAGEFLYRNQGLGFELILPGNWSSFVQEKTYSVTFFYQTGQQAGYVEVYGNSSNDTLNSLSAAIKNSPDTAGNVNQIIVDGLPALSYSGKNGQQGIALIFNNKIYYLHGALTGQIAKVKFF